MGLYCMGEGLKEELGGVWKRERGSVKTERERESRGKRPQTWGFRGERQQETEEWGRGETEGLRQTEGLGEREEVRGWRGRGRWSGGKQVGKRRWRKRRGLVRRGRNDRQYGGDKCVYGGHGERLLTRRRRIDLGMEKDRGGRENEAQKSY